MTSVASFVRMDNTEGISLGELILHLSLSKTLSDVVYSLERERSAGNFYRVCADDVPSTRAEERGKNKHAHNPAREKRAIRPDCL